MTRAARKEQLAPLQTLVTALVVATILGACAKVELKDKTGSKTTTTTQTTSNPAQLQPMNNTVGGDWRVEFQYNNSNLTSTMHLAQEGNHFKGSGTDDQNNLAFVIEKGTFDNGQISFFKQYQGSPPVQYEGKFQIINENGYHGPFMEGDYTTASKGQIINNRWQAQKVTAGQPVQNQGQQAPPPDQMATNQPGQPGQPSQNGFSGQHGSPQDGGPGQGQPPPEAPPSPDQQQPPPGPAWPPEKAPDLSGKWEVGWEYNFKTMHSTMYLEQDGSRVTGHGVDLNTKEKFAVSSGWYNFPNLTLVRKYEKTEKKGKNPGSPERLMTFKAKVAMVADKDYQGPYINGKTQGGGMWEAQLLK